MGVKKNTLIYHQTCIGQGSITVLLDAAHQAGFDGISTDFYELDRYLGAGYSIGDLKNLSIETPIVTTGCLFNCECQGYSFIQLMKECERVFEISRDIGAESVQILTGPLDYRAVESFQKKTPYNGYMGLQGYELKEQVEMTVKNMKEIGKLAAQFGLILYLEPLCWTPVSTIRQGVEICERTGLDNVKIVIDFFHGFVAGDTPDYISKLDPAIIEIIHVCDTKESNGVPNESIIRNVEFGKGDVPIQEWVDAVKATGYVGKWTYETFYLKERELLPADLARDVYRWLSDLIR